jgi:hypothetical protein
MSDMFRELGSKSLGMPPKGQEAGQKLLNGVAESRRGAGATGAVQQMSGIPLANPESRHLQPAKATFVK